MSDMNPRIPALGILFDIGKIESGGYGIESWKIFWKALKHENFYAKLFLFEGDLFSVDNVFCIGIQAFDQKVLNRIKELMMKNQAYLKIAANPSFIDRDAVIKEPLPNAGIIEPNNKFIPEGYNAKASYDKVE